MYAMDVMEWAPSQQGTSHTLADIDSPTNGWSLWAHTTHTPNIPAE